MFASLVMVVILFLAAVIAFITSCLLGLRFATAVESSNASILSFAVLAVSISVLKVANGVFA